MQHVKIFKGVEGDTATLEQEINQWITETGARIVQMSGNIAPQSPGNGPTTGGLGGGGSSGFIASDVLVILVYETD